MNQVNVQVHKSSPGLLNRLVCSYLLPFQMRDISTWSRRKTSNSSSSNTLDLTFRTSGSTSFTGLKEQKKNRVKHGWHALDFNIIFSIYTTNDLHKTFLWFVQLRLKRYPHKFWLSINWVNNLTSKNAKDSQILASKMRGYTAFLYFILM